VILAQHAEVVRQPDGTYQVRDLGSRRGTSSARARSTAQRCATATSSLIGPLRLRFEVTRPPALAIGEPDELPSCARVVEAQPRDRRRARFDRLLERVLETCFQLLRADRGMIIVYGPQSKTPCAMVARTRAGVRQRSRCRQRAEPGDGDPRAVPAHSRSR